MIIGNFITVLFFNPPPGWCPPPPDLGPGPEALGPPGPRLEPAQVLVFHVELIKVWSRRPPPRGTELSELIDGTDSFGI